MSDVSGTVEAVIRFVADCFAWQNDDENYDAVGHVPADDAVYRGLARDYLRTQRGEQCLKQLFEAVGQDAAKKIVAKLAEMGIS